MFERIRSWITGAPGQAQTLLPAETAAQRLAIERCLRAYHSGVEQFQRGAMELAERDMAQALAHKHDLAEAHFYRGLIFRKRAQLDDAADALLLATTFKPDFSEAWFYLGIVDLDRGHHGPAHKSFQTALGIRPEYAEAYNGLASLCEARRDFHAAAAYYRRAIQADAEFALAYCNLAYLLLREFGDADTALELALQAAALDPRLAAAHNNLAMIMQYQARCDEAIAAAERALTLDPDAARPRMSRALARLMLGVFEAGWRDYEARKQLLPTFSVRKFPYPEWDGTPLKGRRLLVHNEQGIGDEIMFASCLPDLLALGGQCVVECSRKLEPLFSRSFPSATIQIADQDEADMSYLAALPKFDWQVAAGTLPLHFRTSRKAFPRHSGYLAADPSRGAYWRERLRELGPGMKLGVSWRGGSHYTDQARRSLELEQMLPLFKMPAAQFVSLQYTDCRVEIEKLGKQSGVVLHHWQEAIDDFDETAALVSALDLVISVQTAVVHLAGALGKPAWVLVSSAPEWRYMLRGEDMPWYPSVRIFRQRHGTDWKPVIEDVRNELLANMATPCGCG